MHMPKHTSVRTVPSAGGRPSHPDPIRADPPGAFRAARPAPGTRRRIRGIPLLLLAAACTGAPAAEVQPSEGAGNPAPVRLADVSREVVDRAVQAPGAVEARLEVPLSFSIGGLIQSVEVDEGDRVQAGQRLASLDPVEIDAVVTRAQSLAEKAERDLARFTRLHADSVIPLAQLQDAATGAAVARADLETALFSRRDAVLVAPSAGTVLRRISDEGARIQPGAPVLTLGLGRGGLIFRAGLPDRELVRIQVGDSASVLFDALPGRPFAGRVERLGAAPDPGTGTYGVEVGLPPGADLPSGMVGRVTIHPRSPEPSTVIPVEALLEADGTQGVVFVLSPDGTLAERRDVTVSHLHGERVMVTSGLEGVRSVITAGGAWLNHGDAVRVTP